MLQGERKTLRGGFARLDRAWGIRPDHDPELRVRADLLARVNGSGDGSGGLEEQVWRSEVCSGPEHLVSMPTRGGSRTTGRQVTCPGETGRPLGRCCAPSSGTTMWRM